MLGPRSNSRLRRRPLGRYRYVRLRWRLLFTAIDVVGSLAFGMIRALRGAAVLGFVGKLVHWLLPGWHALAKRGHVRGKHGDASDAMPPGHRVFRRSLTGTGRPPGATKSSDDPRTILFIQLDHLGDAILSTGMLPALRKRYPKASIEVLAGPAGRELFEAVAEVDRVHVCRVNRFGRASRLGWIVSMLWWGCRLRSRRVDLGIDVRGEFPHAVILWLSGARRRLGWNCGGGGFFLTDSPRYVVDRPEVESRMALLAELGIHPEAAEEVPRPVFRPSDESRRRVAAWLAQSCPKDVGRMTRELCPFPRRANGTVSLSHPLPNPSDGPRIVMHVGAGTPAKQWPVEHWQELVGRLVVRLNAQIVLVGNSGDGEIAGAILGPQPCPGVVDWTGRLSLEELAAVVEEADLFVGADSGPAHLAAAVGTPAVVLFSGTNSPRQWQPCGEHVRVLRRPIACSPCHRRRCPRQDHPCMRGLAPRRVAEAIEEACRGASARRVGRGTRPTQSRSTSICAAWASYLDPPYKNLLARKGERR